MLAINSCISQSIQKTPYEMVFGQSVRHDQEFWKEIHKQSTENSINSNSISNEENIFDLFDENNDNNQCSVKLETCISHQIFLLEFECGIYL